MNERYSLVMLLSQKKKEREKQFPIPVGWVLQGANQFCVQLAGVVIGYLIKKCLFVSLNKLNGICAVTLVSRRRKVLMFSSTVENFSSGSLLR